MVFSFQSLITKLQDSVACLTTPAVSPGAIIDQLSNCHLPARSDLGVVFRHGSNSTDDPSLDEPSRSSLIELRYVDGERRGSIMITEEQAHQLQLDFRSQVEKAQMVSELNLPETLRS